MTGFDYAVAGISLASLLLGWWHGLVHEVLSLLGWPVAFLVSELSEKLFNELFGELFGGSLISLLAFGDERTRTISAVYVLVFIAVLIVWSLLVWMLSKLVKAIGLGWMDSALGGLFGLLRGGLLILALVWVAGLTQLPEQPFWRDALLSKPAEEVAMLTKAWLPDSIAQRIHYGQRS
ncbi:bacteriocin production protein [Ferrigenium kumadai]|uniref:Bacteriocin production protein n=1 Tax=Ferrigenium kumadai TaxID=1682490 RepID=A0AAN1SYM3_9PROT|nr:CvpA family protein [Ferrigenium kumadai]BBI99157.1 bacteriocin production protein [Ferrigenium kumadai]